MKKTDFILLSLFTVTALAADWPQWRGPERNGVSQETGLLKEWPKSGPPLTWKVDTIDKGYSTPSVVKDRIYLLSNNNEEEFVLALDAKDGKRIWSSPVGKVGKNRGPQYPGARSTPTIDDQFLFVLGSDGDLACLETEKGKLQWKRNLRIDFKGLPGHWAYSESPLVDGNMVICTPGGTEATVVALDKKTAGVLWKAAVPGGDEAAYASAIVGEVDGNKEYIQFVQKGVIGIDASSGKFLWRYDKTTDMAANIPTPLFHNGFVFSATGRNGAGLVKLKPDKDGVNAEQVYYTRELANGLGGAVRVGKYVYGTNEAFLVCLDFVTGKLMWKDRSVAPGSICYADGRLYLRGDKGFIALVDATSKGYHERGRFKQPERSDKPAWPYPVVANGHLYLRDQNLLYCYDIRATTEK